jgi:outer membrane lipoprotein-sorting protein
LVCAGRASASALGDFADAWSKVDDYSCSIVVHEVLGTQTQDRRYDFWFKKPSLAKIEITSGPGKGSGSVWRGGDTVVGHMGGLLAFAKKTISINDPRAVTLRGDTIASASFGYILSVYQSNIGTLTEAPGPAIDGVPTEMLSLKIADPAANKNVSRDVLYLSKATHLPVRRVRYDGDTLVKQEDFVGVKLNPGLKDSAF